MSDEYLVAADYLDNRQPNKGCALVLTTELAKKVNFIIRQLKGNTKIDDIRDEVILEWNVFFYSDNLTTAQRKSVLGAFLGISVDMTIEDISRKNISELRRCWKTRKTTACFLFIAFNLDPVLNQR